jgi:hypothetical protein
MSRLKTIPLDILQLIWDNLSHRDIDKLFVLYPHLREDINFWKAKLTKDIYQAANRWPHLYVFNISKKRQNIFFDKICKDKLDSDIIINTGKILEETYLSCLYIFDIYIPEAKDYWNKDQEKYWHYVRGLSYKWEMTNSFIYRFILFENDVDPEILINTMEYNIPNLDFIRLLVCKYGPEFLETQHYREILLKLTIFTIDKSSGRLSNFLEKTETVRKILIREYAEYLDNKIKNFIYKIEVNINKLHNPLLVHTQYHQILDYREDYRSGLNVIKILKDPNFDMKKKLPLIDMRFGGDNSGIENLCYYLVKKDNLILLNKVYNECIPKSNIDISWFLVNMFNFIIPGSKIYGRIIELTPRNIYIDKISGFPLLYNLCLAFPNCKFKTSYPEAFKLIQILQGKSKFESTYKQTTIMEEDNCSYNSSGESDSSCSGNSNN